jgi:hypothetical protein
VKLGGLVQSHQLSDDQILTFASCLSVCCLIVVKLKCGRDNGFSSFISSSFSQLASGFPVQQKIALFAAPMREQTGSAPGFLEKFVSQFIFTNV